MAKDAALPALDDDAVDDGPAVVRISDHPRARHSIARVRAWAALIGFGLTAFLANRAGVPFVDAVIRSIAIGAAASLVGWAGAQAVWRQIIFAELAARRREANEAQQRLLAELEDAAGQPGDAPPL